VPAPELRPCPRAPLGARLRPPQSGGNPAAAGATLRLDAWGGFAELAARLGLPVHGPLVLPGEWDLR
jgi:protease-4